MKFTIDSPVFRFLETMAEFTILNLAFIITCIPIFTIGPAICALSSITMREIREEHGYIIRPYLKSLGENFKSGFHLFLIYAAIGGILLFNLVFWAQMNTVIGNIVFFILIFFSVLYLLPFCYSFALNARFTNTIRQTIKNSILIALSEMKHSIILLLLLCLAVALYCLTNTGRIFFMIFGFAFFSYCQSYILVKVFHKYESMEQI